MNSPNVIMFKKQLVVECLIIKLWYIYTWSITQPLKRIHLNQFYEVDETGADYTE